MRIVHIGYEHHANDVRIFLKECNVLKENGWEITYITSNKHDSANDKMVENIRVITLPIFEKRGVRRVLKFYYDVLKKCLELDADVYHVHEYILLPVANRLVRKGKKVIYDTHENYTEEMKRTVRAIQPFKSIICKTLEDYEKRTISKLSGLVCAVPDVYKILKKYNQNNVLLQNFPVIGDLDCNMDDYLDRHSLVCYTGIISYERGLSTIVKSLDKTKVKLILAGKMTESYQKELKSFQQWENVDYRGLLDRKEMSETVLSKSIAGLVTFMPIPGYNNSVPNKLFEYMSAGLPFIASDFNQWRERLEKHKCGIFVDPSNPGKIAEAINFISSNREEALKMGINGRNAVLNEFNWQSESSKLIKLYENLERF